MRCARKAPPCLLWPTITWFQALPVSHWFLEHSFTLAGKSRLAAQICTP